MKMKLNLVIWFYIKHLFTMIHLECFTSSTWLIWELDVSYFSHVAPRRLLTLHSLKYVKVFLPVTQLVDEAT